MIKTPLQMYYIACKKSLSLVFKEIINLKSLYWRPFVTWMRKRLIKESVRQFNQGCTLVHNSSVQLECGSCLPYSRKAPAE